MGTLPSSALTRPKPRVPMITSLAPRYDAILASTRGAGPLTSSFSTATPL